MARPQKPSDCLPKKPKAAPRNNAETKRISAKAFKEAKRQVLNQGFETPNHTIIKPGTSIETLKRQKDLMSATLLEQKRELGRENFWYFFTRILFPDVWQEHYTEDFHRPIAQILQDLPDGSNQMFILPREHRKSYLATLGFSLWHIIRNPNIRIMLIGAKERTVKKWSILMRSAFMPGNNSFRHFQEVYWDYVFTKKGNTPLQAIEWSLEIRSAALPDTTYTATYLGVTGAGGRANIQIYDDPYERRNVNNPQLSLKALEQTLDLFPLVEVSESAPLRMRIFNATRWAYHDPIGTFLGEKHEDAEEADLDEAPEFNAMVRHAFEDPKRPCELCPRGVMEAFPHGHPDVEKGDPILYPIITREGLMKRYREYCAHPEKGEALWYHQYQNICLAPSDQKYQKEWFIFGHMPTWGAPRSKVLCIDSADKDFQQEGLGDYMVAQFGEFDDFGKLMLVHGIRSNKWTREKFLRKILVWCQATNWWPHKVAKEKFGSDNFLTDIGREFMTAEHPVHKIAVQRPSQSGVNYMKKMDWIVESTQAPVERAELIIGSSYPKDLANRLVYEFTNLGQVKNDDMADCTALFYVKGVRSENVQKHGIAASVPAPPDMMLYQGPGEPPPMKVAVPQSAMEQALQSRPVMVAIEELGQVNISSPEDKNKSLVAKLD